MPTVYAALDDRLLVAEGSVPAAEDAGDDVDAESTDWTVSERLAGRRVQCLAAVGGRVLVGTFDAGLHLSADGGESFERVGADALHEAVTAVAAGPHDPEEWWAGTEPSAVFRSTDGGRTWTGKPGLTDLPSASEWYFPPRPDTHHARWIEPDPADPDRLFVGIEAGALVRSFDRGESWQDRPGGARRDNHGLATHPDAPGRLYAAAGDGFAVSDDAGDSWSYPQDGLEHRYCWSVVPDPADPGTVLLSSASGPRTAHTAETAESYVYRRDGGPDGDGDLAGDDGLTGDEGGTNGSPWEVAMDGLPDPEGTTRATLATTGEAGTFYALTNRGLFRTTDAGRSWTDAGLPWRDDYRDAVSRGLVVLP